MSRLPTLQTPPGSARARHPARQASQERHEPSNPRSVRRCCGTPSGPSAARPWRSRRAACAGAWTSTRTASRRPVRPPGTAGRGRHRCPRRSPDTSSHSPGRPGKEVDRRALVGRMMEKPRRSNEHVKRRRRGSHREGRNRRSHRTGGHGHAQDPQGTELPGHGAASVRLGPLGGLRAGRRDGGGRGDRRLHRPGHRAVLRGRCHVQGAGREGRLPGRRRDRQLLGVARAPRRSRWSSPR
ncbi:hypothetical protein SVIOM74S_01740 [Streptomyces violarus]